MGQEQSGLKDSSDPAGEFVQVRDGKSRKVREPNEAQKKLQHLDEMHSTLPLLKMPGEGSWREMLTETDAMSDHGVGSINTGGLASMLDAYQDWASRKLHHVIDAQRNTMNLISQAEGSTSSVFKLYMRSSNELKRSSQQLALVSTLGEEVLHVRRQLDRALASYEELVEGLDMTAIESDDFEHRFAHQATVTPRQAHQAPGSHTFKFQKAPARGSYGTDIM